MTDPQSLDTSSAVAEDYWNDVPQSVAAAEIMAAREQGAAVLATRALDGVVIDVWYHGAVVGTRTVHDPRLMLAHMARLDRQIEGNEPARARAERFDELLAGYAGLAEPDGFACVAADASPEAPALPPTRGGFVAWLRDAVAEDFEEDEEDEAGERLEAIVEAEAEAGAVWDAWHADGRALVGAILDGHAAAPSTAACAQAGASQPASGDGERVSDSSGDPPIEFKSAQLGLPGGRASRPCAFLSLDRVAGVRRGSPSADRGPVAARRRLVTKSQWRDAGEAL